MDKTLFERPKPPGRPPFGKPRLEPYGWYCQCGCGDEGWSAQPEAIERLWLAFRDQHQREGCRLLTRAEWLRLRRERRKDASMRYDE